MSKTDILIERDDTDIDLEFGDIVRVYTDKMHENVQQMSTPYINFSLIVVVATPEYSVCIDESLLVHILESKDGEVYSHAPKEWNEDVFNVKEMEVVGHDEETAAKDFVSVIGDILD